MLNESHIKNPLARNRQFLGLAKKQVRGITLITKLTDMQYLIVAKKIFKNAKNA